MKRIFLFVIIPLALMFGLLLANGFTVFDFGRQAGSTDLSRSDANPDSSVNHAYPAGSEEQFQFLSQQTSSTCSLQPDTVAGYPDAQRIQGSCCAPMDLHRYQEQVEGLKQYADIPQVPEDPYDIPAGLAKELFGYQQTITLTAEQQERYDTAMELSDEGGPCCCQCWRWHAFDGQAKYLITELDWTTEQIAELWDLEDGCGGTGHEHGA